MKSLRRFYLKNLTEFRRPRPVSITNLAGFNKTKNKENKHKKIMSLASLFINKRERKHTGILYGFKGSGRQMAFRGSRNKGVN